MIFIENSVSQMTYSTEFSICIILKGCDTNHRIIHHKIDGPPRLKRRGLSQALDFGDFRNLRTHGDLRAIKI